MAQWTLQKLLVRKWHEQNFCWTFMTNGHAAFIKIKFVLLYFDWHRFDFDMLLIWNSRHAR